jgi:membrane associated rhomboid family serine protease
MIPFSDPSEPDHVFPYVNISLIVVNFLVFFYELSLGSQSTGTLNRFIFDYGMVPCEYTSHCHAYPGTPSPYYVTLFSSMFMHGGWLHILGNMLYLWVFGDNIENAMGHFRYLIFYLLCGLAANGLEIATAVTSNVPGIGASGAIAGVLGAYLMLFPGSRIRTLIPFTFIFLFIPLRLPAWVLIGFWFVLQFVSGVAVLSARTAQAQGGVAYWAHVGGFVAGCILVWIFRHPRRTQQWQRYHAGPRAYS